MSQKRNPDESTSQKYLEGNQSPDDKRRRIPRSFKSVVLEVMTQIRFQRIQQTLEPMLRKVVKEEIESAIRKHAIYFKRHCEQDVIPSDSRNLQLKFLNTLSLPVFTGARIEGEDGPEIKVALVDTLTDEVVHYAPESSAKGEVVVLEGDFDADKAENWTLEEFENNIVRQREGKKPLLTGGVCFCLKEGIGSVGAVSFTDNSSWTRSRRFRLGARLVGNFDGARIKEAKTESFIVRDHRGELYRKHHPPCLSDEVWRLEKIGKDGAFHKRLRSAKVNTVQDFLTLFHTDPALLRSILGAGMSAKMWEVTVDHARTCVLEEQVYLYYPPTEHNNGVVFNVVGQVMGLYSESHFVPINKMTDNDKTNAQEMVAKAIQQQWEGVTSYKELNSLLLGVSPQTASSSGTMTPDERNALKSKESDPLDYAQPSMHIPSSGVLPSILSMGHVSSSSDDFSLQAIDTSNPKFDHPLDSPLRESDYLMETFHDNEHLGFLDIGYPSFQSVNPSLEFHPTSSNREVRRPAYRRWRVLSSVVRWLMGRTGGQEKRRRH